MSCKHRHTQDVQMDCKRKCLFNMLPEQGDLLDTLGNWMASLISCICFHFKSQLGDLMCCLNGKPSLVNNLIWMDEMTGQHFCCTYLGHTNRNTTASILLVYSILLCHVRSFYISHLPHSSLDSVCSNNKEMPVAN